MDSLTVSVDLGASLTKTFYSVNGGELNYTTMLPDVVEISKESLQNHFDLHPTLQSSHPKNVAWVESEEDDQCEAVGLLAKNLYSVSQLKALKYEGAVAKILAAVGAIAQYQNLAARFNLSLITLLPYSESSSVKLLTPELEQRLKHYQFRRRTLKVRLQKFLCYPEGSGLMAALQGRRPTQGRVAICMIGYRNTSILLFQSGQLTKGYTNDLGFYNLLEIVQRLTPGQNPEDLAPVLHKYFAEDFGINRINWLSPLLKSRQPHHRQQELEQIQSAAHKAHEEYWRRLSTWLTEFLPDRLDAVVFAGGAAPCFKKQLNKLCPVYSPYWGDDLQDELSKILELSDKSATFRALDSYGSFCHLQSLVEATA